MSQVAAPERALEDDEYAERHVYEPHRVGLPPLRSYLSKLWQRRQFAYELSRTTLRAQHFNTLLGQVWLVLNPVLLALVYFLLVNILQSGKNDATFFAHLMASLFAFQFVSHSVTQGAKSVVSSGRLILNTAFPRTLLPVSAVITAFLRFLPTFAVYVVCHIAAGLPIGLHLLWVVPIMATLIVFATGVATLVSAMQVYFRDISSFLPYFTRVWLYGSPVLYYVSEIPDRYKPFLYVNPLTPMLGAWSDVLNQGHAPAAGELAAGAAWAVGFLVVGCLFFMSREREFAVRL